MSKKIFPILLLTILFVINISAQTKTVEAIEKQVKNLRLAQTKLTYNPDSNMSKIMTVADDFGYEQDKAAKVQGFNFGMAFFFQGKALTAAPPEINLTFWVKTDKPRFAENHHLTVFAGNETLDLGDARYAAKPNENMEYLNFKFSPETLSKIGNSPEARLKIGDAEFNFLPSHLKILSGIVKIADPSEF